MKIVKVGQWVLGGLALYITLNFLVNVLSMTKTTKTNRLTSSLSTWIIPQNLDLGIYFKEATNFKKSANLDTSHFILTAQLSEKNFIKLKQKLNQIKIKKYKINCWEPKYIAYMALCRIMEVNKKSKIKIYILQENKDNELIYWALYKRLRKIGIFTPFPSESSIIYKKYIKSFKPLHEINTNYLINN